MDSVGQSGKTLVCIACGGEFEFTAAEARALKQLAYPPRKRCSTCLERKKFALATTFADMTLRCRGCHKSFVFSVGEQRYCVERNLSPFSRCASCRAARRALRQWAEGGQTG
jgi:hypothetical protein